MNVLKIFYLVIPLSVTLVWLFQVKALGQTAEEECGTRTAIEQYWIEQEPLPRPVLQDEDAIGTTNFIIHYTLVGNDATTQEKANYTGSFAEEVWAATDNLGWALPPPWGGEPSGGFCLYYPQISRFFRCW